MLLYYLEANEHVKKATVYERTCDAVIYYEEGRRGDILTYLSRFDFEKENVRLQVPENTGRALTRLYSEKFVSNIVFNLVKAYIFPAPLRIAHTIYMAGKYILKGIKGGHGGAQ